MVNATIDDTEVYAHGVPKSLEEHILASCGKYKPGSDVLEYLTDTLWEKSDGFALTAEVGARHALVLIGLDQHPAFDPSRVEFAIRCCGGDPAEVSLGDFILAATKEVLRQGGALSTTLWMIGTDQLSPFTPASRAIYLILECVAQKGVYANEY